MIGWFSKIKEAKQENNLGIKLTISKLIERRSLNRPKRKKFLFCLKEEVARQQDKIRHNLIWPEGNPKKNKYNNRC